MKKILIKEITTKIFSGGTPSTQNQEYWDGEYNWLSSGETKNKFILKTDKTITKEGIDNSSTKLSLPGDILIASAGQGQTRGQVSYNCIKTYINQSIICLRANHELINSKYLFYNLSTKYDLLRQLSDANSIRGSLTTKLVADLEINIHNIDMQQHIVNINIMFPLFQLYQQWISYTYCKLQLIFFQQY